MSAAAVQAKWAEGMAHLTFAVDCALTQHLAGRVSLLEHPAAASTATATTTATASGLAQFPHAGAARSRSGSSHQRTPAARPSQSERCAQEAAHYLRCPAHHMRCEFRRHGHGSGVCLQDEDVMGHSVTERRRRRRHTAQNKGIMGLITGPQDELGVTGRRRCRTKASKECRVVVSSSRQW